MALIYESWRADGDGQSRIDWLRSDCREYTAELAQDWVNNQRKNCDCVLITRSRTDRQSDYYKTVWIRPGYVDPCTATK